MNSLIEAIRTVIRRIMRSIAKALNTISGGKLSPNAVTLFGLLMHLPIAWLISEGYFGYAAGLLVIFSLFDAIDGELARLQKKSSATGMFVDSVADRMKEILIYCGLVSVLVTSGASKTTLIVLAAALGVSVLTSYLNAWGEVVLANFTRSQDHQVNKTFRSGLLGFDIRMFLLVIGLASNKLAAIVWIILVLGSLTVFQRFLNITKTLRDVQS